MCVCSMRLALGSYFHMHCLPSLDPQASRYRLCRLPWRQFWVHLIFDVGPKSHSCPIARSANTNAARTASPSYFKQLFPNFDLCCTLIQNFQGFLCSKTATELAQLPPTVTWAPGWPTLPNCGRHTLLPPSWFASTH